MFWSDCTEWLASNRRSPSPGARPPSRKYGPPMLECLFHDVPREDVDLGA
ncbi:MAG: hypothetical protein QOJ46_2526 [bacterium]